MKSFTFFIALLLSMLSGRLFAAPDISVVFIVDESIQLSASNAALQQQGLSHALDQLPNNGQVEVSVVSMETTPKILVENTELDASSKLDSIKTALKADLYSGSSTNMTGSISTAEHLLNRSTAKRKVICLASNGIADNIPAANASATRLKDTGVVIFPMGIGLNSQEKAFLDGLASNPPASYMTTDPSTLFKEGCINKIQQMLGNTITLPLKNGIEPSEIHLSVFFKNELGVFEPARDINKYTIIDFNSRTKLGASIVDNGNLGLTYTPLLPFQEEDTYEYTIRNNITGEVQDNNGFFHPLYAYNDTVSSENTVIIDVLKNDLNYSGDLISIYDFDNDSLQGGKITINSDHTLTYVPKSGFTGVDSFKYSIQTSSGYRPTATWTEGSEIVAGGETINTAIVTITVGTATNSNNPPTANNDTAITLQDTAVNIDNVLSNDTDTDNDTLSITSVDSTSSQGGTISNNNAVFLYTPPTGFTGTDSFNYSISDGKGETATATVTITVSAGNHVPIANNDSASLEQDSTKTFSVLSNDTDNDNDILTITTVDTLSAQNGTIVNNGDGTLTYTPANGFTGTDSFNYTISDGKSGSNTGTVNITVTIKTDTTDTTTTGTTTESNSSAVNDEITTTEGNSVSLNVLSNDNGTSNNTIVTFTNPNNGTLVDKGAGNFSYTPKANFVGVDSFSYTIQDSNGVSSSAIVNIKINGAGGAATVGAGSMEGSLLWLLLVLYCLHLGRQHPTVLRQLIAQKAV